MTYYLVMHFLYLKNLKCYDFRELIFVPPYNQCISGHLHTVLTGLFYIVILAHHKLLKLDFSVNNC